MLEASHVRNVRENKPGLESKGGKCLCWTGGSGRISLSSKQRLEGAGGAVASRVAGLAECQDSEMKGCLAGMGKVTTKHRQNL